MIISFLLKLNRTRFLLLGIGLSILTVLLYAIITTQSEGLNPNVNYSTIPDIIETYISGVILVPILETILFQTFIYWLINKLVKTEHTRNLVFIIISSVIFGCSHYYSISYIIYTIAVGFILSYFYIVSIKRTESATKNVFIIHASFNLILITGGTILFLIDNNHL